MLELSKKIIVSKEWLGNLRKITDSEGKGNQEDLETEGENVVVPCGLEVGPTGFEPATPWYLFPIFNFFLLGIKAKCSARLSYEPLTSFERLG